MKQVKDRRLTNAELVKLGASIARLRDGGGISDFMTTYDKLIKCYQEVVERRAAARVDREAGAEPIAGYRLFRRRATRR